MYRGRRTAQFGPIAVENVKLQSARFNEAPAHMYRGSTADQGLTHELDELQ